MGIPGRFGFDVGHCDIHLRLVPKKKVAVNSLQSQFIAFEFVAHREINTAAYR